MRKTRIITDQEVLDFIKSPLCIAICGIIACLIAFNTGIQYARRTVEVHSIVQHLAFIEIAGEERMYELDWCESQPIEWNNN